MAVNRQQLDEFMTGFLNNPWGFYQDAVRVHKTVYWRVAGIVIFLIALYTGASYTRHPMIIAVSNTVLIFALGYQLTTPGVFAVLFGGGAARQFSQYNINWQSLFDRNPNTHVFPDVKMAELFHEGWQFWVEGLRIGAYAIVIIISSGMVMEFFPVRQPGLAVIIFTGLAAIGIWVFAFNLKGDRWFKWITGTIIILGTIASAYQTFAFVYEQDTVVNTVEEVLMLNDNNAKAGELDALLQKARNKQPLSQDEVRLLKGLQAERDNHQLGGVYGWVADKEKHLFPDERTVFIHDLNDVEVCGLRPGEQSFDVKSEVWKTINGTPTRITATFRFNGVNRNEPFTPNEHGCATRSSIWGEKDVLIDQPVTFLFK